MATLIDPLLTYLAKPVYGKGMHNDIAAISNIMWELGWEESEIETMLEQGTEGGRDRQLLRSRLPEIYLNARRAREEAGRPLVPRPKAKRDFNFDDKFANMKFDNMGNIIPPSPPQEVMPWPEALQKAIITSVELRRKIIRPKAPLLGDWFAEGDLGFIYAKRGTGKTWLAIAIAEALSLGTQLGEWKAHAPVKVLYVDGEMPPDLTRSRMKGLELKANENLEVLNHELLFDATQRSMNITQPDLQAAITERCLATGVKVLILDNLSTLAAGMKENDADAWEMVNQWLLILRRHRIAVVIVHHAGRSGEMRGTSRREDNVFWIIALDDLKQTAGAEDRKGAHFISRFSKPSRNTQEETPAYRWHFTTEKNGTVTVQCEQADELEAFRKIVEGGNNKCSDIAAEMKVEPFVVSRLAKRAKDAGWLRTNSYREYEIIDELPATDMTSDLL
jgi:putative DNA primase/helicase